LTAAALNAPPAGSGDRLALALCLAIVIHALILLGVSFTFERHSAPRYETMDIVLVQQKTKKAPKKPEALAQANLQGGGHSEKPKQPSNPFPAPFPEVKPDIAPAAHPLPAPAATPAPPEQVMTEAAPPVAPKAPERAQAVPPPAPKELVAKSEHARHPLQVAPAQKPKPAKHERAAAQARKVRKPVRKEHLSAAAKPVPLVPPAPAVPTAAQLISDSFAVASLSAEISKQISDQARRPRRKFISAATREYKYAAYMEAWRSKVERIGNLNYPEKARQEGLSGSLILDVAILPDGSVKDITIRRSSGFKVLDDAAIRIVKLAAPFAAFPPDIAKEVDILHIVRTWQFLDSAGFSSK